MIRTVVRLLVFVLVLHAGFRTVPAFWTYYKFRDAVAETARFSSRRTADEVAARVMAIAARMEVPLAADALRVTKREARTRVEATYTADLEYFPRRSYPWRFEIDVEEEPPRYAEVTP
jgi:hypothetical protein